MEERTLLLLSSVYPNCLESVSATRRFLGFSRHLQEHGWRTVALAPVCRCVAQRPCAPNELRLAPAGSPAYVPPRTQDGIAVVGVETAPSALLRLWIRDARVAHRQPALNWEMRHRLPDVGRAAATPPGRPSLSRTLRRKAAALTLRLTGHFSDWQALTEQAATIVGRIEPVRAVLSSSPVEAIHPIARRVASRLGVAWFADVRDAVARSPLGGGRRTLRALRRASTLIYVTEGERRRDRALLPATPAAVIENGFLEAEVERARRVAVLDFDHFVLRFLGKPRPRPLDCLFRGLMSLRADEPQLAARLRFESYGPAPDYRRAAGQNGELDGIASFHGNVDPQRALELAASATALVLPTLGQDGVPGGKFYEYLGVRRPILAVGGPDPYVARVVPRQDSIRVLEADRILLASLDFRLGPTGSPGSAPSSIFSGCAPWSSSSSVPCSPSSGIE